MRVDGRRVCFKMNYLYATQRQGNLEDTKAWQKGESHYLKMMLGVGFYDTLYICENNIVSFYYNEKEIKAFENALEVLVGEEKFNDLCNNFMKLCNSIPNMKTDEDKLDLFSRMIPALTIFDEFDSYPDYMGTFGMQRRLLRVREATHNLSYEFLKGVGTKEPKNFILYKGEAYLK